MSTASVTAIHPVAGGTFHSKPQMRNPLVAVEGKARGLRKSVGFIPWRRQMSVQNFISVLPVVEIFSAKAVDGMTNQTLLSQEPQC